MRPRKARTSRARGRRVSHPASGRHYMSGVGCTLIGVGRPVGKAHSIAATGAVDLSMSYCLSVTTCCKLEHFIPLLPFLVCWASILLHHGKWMAFLGCCLRARCLFDDWLRLLACWIPSLPCCSAGATKRDGCPPRRQRSRRLFTRRTNIVPVLRRGWQL